MTNLCFLSIWQDVAKQTGFVTDLCNYISQQWVEFFRVKSSTAQVLVEEIGPFFRKRDGSFHWSLWFWVQFAVTCICEHCGCVCVSGRGRPQVHLQDHFWCCFILLHIKENTTSCPISLWTKDRLSCLLYPCEKTDFLCVSRYGSKLVSRCILFEWGTWLHKNSKGVDRVCTKNLDPCLCHNSSHLCSFSR